MIYLVMAVLLALVMGLAVLDRRPRPDDIDDTYLRALAQLRNQRR